MRFQEIPRTIRLWTACMVLNVAVFTALRLIFLWAFNIPEDPLGPLLSKSLYTGLKFDLRLAALMNLPVLLLSWVIPISPFERGYARWLWNLYLLLINLIVLLVYIFDFGHFAYLGQRLDATALRFVLNPAISARMIWESYPVIPVAAGLIAFLAGFGFLIFFISRRAAASMLLEATWLRRAMIYIVAIALSLGAIYGKFSRYPLRWSDAFFSTHPFSSALASNPALFFYETLKKQKDMPWSQAQVEKHYPLVSKFLGVDRPDPGTLDFSRSVVPPRGTVRPNVVIVLLESFVHLKLGSFGNPMDPTPNFDRLARDGLLFTRFYTPHSGTARSVFATITGIPDVETDRTASRNPMVVRQHSIINAFRGYERFYFLGGSLNWANIRGLLQRNIEGLNIYEEGSYSSPVIDVWGISDLHLFEEANRVLSRSEKPFFAIIQTSGNHRPYTIPDDNRGFQIREVPEEEIKAAGFDSQEEFNSFRFMDHSIGKFIEMAKKEDYFRDTIFVFYGDHGLPGFAEHVNEAEEQLRLTSFHVPLLIYSPGLVKRSARIGSPASEVDVLPTVASMAGIPYLNTTIGRDLMDPAYRDWQVAFVMFHYPTMPRIGVISKGFYLAMDADGRNVSLHDYNSETPRDDVSEKQPGRVRVMSGLARGIHETAKYMLYNNKPRTE